MKRRGFTLIELLVVIVILGILSSIVVVYVGNSRLRARDVKRKTDVKQMSSAIEQYAIANGKYPSAVSYGGSEDNDSPSRPTFAGACSTSSIHWAKRAWDELQGFVAPYITSLPLDPLAKCTNDSYFTSIKENVHPNYTYLSHPIGQHYSFVVQLENDKDTESNSYGTSNSWTANEAVTKGKYTKVTGLYYYHVLVYTNTAGETSAFKKSRAQLMGVGGNIE